tara:strand:- start:1045 stop:1269 length:225 start_codon:yes stop_codon:yes gene_type:complete
VADHLSFPRFLSLQPPCNSQNQAPTVSWQSNTTTVSSSRNFRYQAGNADQNGKAGNGDHDRCLGFSSLRIIRTV